MKFSINDFLTADLIKFTEEILDGKLHFLCRVIYFMIIEKNFVKRVSSFSGDAEIKK